MAECEIKWNHSRQKCGCFQLYFLRFVWTQQTLPSTSEPSESRSFLFIPTGAICFEDSRTTAHTHTHTREPQHIQENPLNLRLNYLGNKNGTREKGAFHCVCFTPDPPAGWRRLALGVRRAASVDDRDQDQPLCFWLN